MPAIQVPVTKSKSFVTIDTDALPDDVYKEALLLGLGVLANRGTSKITKTTYPNAEELKVAAQAKAEEQVQLIMTSKIKFKGKSAAKKGTGAINTEARRLAKNAVKDELKRLGIRLVDVGAKGITKLANDALASDDSYYKQAEINLAEREKVVSKFDISALLPNSAELIAKGAAAKAKKVEQGKQLSAKQAGKVAPRAKAKGKGKPAQVQA